ncbi:peptide chain release factor 3 [Bacillus marinisedimentorum]|uniref:peptide chain release factor 3 n=1 Tax=Bacillus marinisedimentorum TaxID=1821260 RepID=UPI001B7FF53C|nr:peptide chain release factor 3 [Bacillus marinisedimentorum]
MSTLDKNNEYKKRRTFAIISHPDAGKTTLTEKLLYLGGAIHKQGTVKARKSKNFATSDWMELEKQRGISVTSSVMQFDYDGVTVNILDTPGHEDFSEDTYRTLMAVDSVVMIIDAAKGVEAQTKKLFKVVSQRGIPIFTFINKLDRQGREPLELLEEIEEVLGIHSHPMNWPIGMGMSFRGVYDRKEDRLEFYETRQDGQSLEIQKWEDLEPHLDPSEIDKLQEDIMLLDEAGNPYDKDAIDNGKLTPVFFGSAISGFGVPSFLYHYLQLAPLPQPRKSTEGLIDPSDDTFSGFVFKIQANMNPAHRDRIAFLRIVSGKFQRGMTAKLDRTGKPMKLAQGQQFFAENREGLEEAYPGDIIGLYDPGVFQIGDTLYEGKNDFSFEPLPQFPPEHFARVRTKNAMKQKHFYKGLEQLSQEGAIQVYKTPDGTNVFLGAVGVLQFEVFQYRMENEYNVDIEISPIPHKHARWVENWKDSFRSFDKYSNMLVHDRYGRPVFLFENDFSLRWFGDQHPEVELKG